MAVIELTIKTLSPIHLSSGEADVIVDSEVAHDKYGMPVFSGRRVKGLLRESALEVVCMQGLEKYGYLISRLFEHDCKKSCPEALNISDFHITPREDYAEFCQALESIQEEYAAIISPADVLEEFTSIRYQTKMKDGLAEKGSFRNIRVVNEDLDFYGVIEAEQLSEEALELIALAVRNLRGAGMKRNRGFGRISCSMKLSDNQTEQDIIDKLFAKEVR
ncbi:MAG: hypothetical protein K6C05_08385 [Anaerovibrio sp.]|uniref:RAMP superfamily CRISPR-associated protein n=1 Tax=Anaerovibrio sp. TaxID=1872532 RepID=UPI0025FDE36D|nr:RAMP superfamily CRISPR-associated protein [Anaerovibrio sp.]MCR5176854.1 hypothetical protein [Anaerovibrio sp.]